MRVAKHTANEALATVQLEAPTAAVGVKTAKRTPAAKKRLRRTLLRLRIVGLSSDRERTRKRSTTRLPTWAYGHFDNPALEQDFISYCQMASPVALKADQFEGKRQELLDQSANHIWQPEFELPGAANKICGESLLEPVQNIQEPMMRLPEETQMFATLCTTRLLSTTEETSVLTRLHFLKYLAHRILMTEPVDQWTLARAEGLLRAAQWHRTLFVQCNMRLVVSIIRKLPYPRIATMNCSAMVSLVCSEPSTSSIPCRGYRFCTYATTVIRRECFQQIQERQDENTYCVQSAALSVLATVRGLAMVQAM